MILQLNHPWLPLRMVLGGLPLVVVRIWPVPDALSAVEEADAASENQVLKAHPPAEDL